MEEVGRPTLLTDEVLDKIKQGVLDGLTLKEIALRSQINEGSLYQCHAKNYLNLADKVEGWKRDRKLMLADITSDTIQTLPIVDENGKIDKELLKLKQKEAEFIRETLGKQIYSKRTEQTGPDGTPFQIQVVNYGNTPTPIHTETISTPVLESLGRGSEETGEDSSSSEWEGFVSDGEPTEENA